MQEARRNINGNLSVMMNNRKNSLKDTLHLLAALVSRKAKEYNSS